MTLLKVSLIKYINDDALIKCQDNQFYKKYFSRKCSQMAGFTRVIVNVIQIWHFFECH